MFKLDTTNLCLCVMVRIRNKGMACKPVIAIGVNIPPYLKLPIQIVSQCLKLDKSNVGKQYTPVLNIRQCSILCFHRPFMIQTVF